MKNRRGKHRARMSFDDARHKIIKRSDPARGDDRHRHRIRHRARQFQVVALFGAVAIHRREQDFAGAIAAQFYRVLHRVDAGGVASAMGEDLEALAHALGVDKAANNALAKPNFSGASSRMRIVGAAAPPSVLTDTLSAPASSSPRMSSMPRTPPPTVNGMKQAEAVRRTTSSRDRPLLVARGDARGNRVRPRARAS